MTKYYMLQELYDTYVGSSGSATTCTLDGCMKEFKDRKCLIRHVGSTHNKVSKYFLNLSNIFPPPSLIAVKTLEMHGTEMASERH